VTATLNRAGRSGATQPHARNRKATMIYCAGSQAGVRDGGVATHHGWCVYRLGRTGMIAKPNNRARIMAAQRCSDHTT
jgi:hypothetical protein